MGLLDDPNTAGLGLLALGSGLLGGAYVPPGMPMSSAYSRGAQQGLQGLLGVQNAQNMADLRGIQTKLAQAELAKADREAARDQSWQSMFAPSQSAGAPGASGAPLGGQIAQAGSPQSSLAMVPPGLRTLAGTLGPDKGGALLAQYFMRDDDPSKAFKFESGSIYDLRQRDERGAPRLVGTYSAQAPWQFSTDTTGAVSNRPGATNAASNFDYATTFAKEAAQAPWKTVPIEAGGGLVQPFGNMMPKTMPTYGAPPPVKNDKMSGLFGQDVLQGGSGNDLLQGPGSARVLIAPNKNPPGTQENSFDKSYGEELGKEAATIHKNADKARDQIQSAQMLRGFQQLWRDGGGGQNWTAPMQARWAAVAQGLGIDPASLGLPKDAGPAQAMEAIVKKLAMGNIGGEGGMPANNFSEADRNFLIDIQPRLGDTAAGWEAKLMMTEKMAGRTAEKEAMWNRYQDEGKSYRQFRSDWGKYVSQNSIFTDQDKSRLQALSPQAQTSGGLSADDAALVKKHLRR